MALRPDVALVLAGCEAQYLALCTVVTLPSGCEDEYKKKCRAAPSLLMGGDFGRVSAPRLVSYTVDDPDNGDAVFGDGDVLTMRFDQATNKGEPHSDFEQAGVYI